MSVEKPSLEEAISFCAHEAELRKWFTGMQTYLEGLKSLQREQEKAERARDEALKARDKAYADIEARQTKDAKAAEKERADLAAMLARDQAQADKALVAAQAEHKKLLATIDQARIHVTLAEEDRDAKRGALEQEITALTAERDTIRAEEAAIRGRLTAALGR